MLVLASNSPRRHEILEAAGIEHIVKAKPIDESRWQHESPGSLVKRLAEQKARAVSGVAGDLVLGADTVVVLDDQVFGKPVDDEDAGRMLRALSGGKHRVYTGICLLSDARVIVDVCITEVEFVLLDDDEIGAYVATGEPMDKAGGYGIQGLASKFIRRIEGCYQNVVGLPISLVYRHLKSF